jgi:hypothetical protein
MGKALEVITGFVTAPSTTFTGLTMGSGNSLTIRNAPLDSTVLLLQAWALNQTVGTLRIRSPKLHDNVQGIRLDVTASDAKPLLPWGVSQKLIPQDLLIAELTGSATAGDIEQAAMLIYYANLPGGDARLAAAEDVIRRGVNVVSVENTITNGTAGGWSAEEAINSEFDLLKANTDYALIGYLIDAECTAVRWRGADTANLGVGGPGDELGRDVTCDWFLKLSKLFGMPLVPVFNSANKSGILIDVADDENATAHTVTSLFVELAPGTLATPARA